MPQSRLEQPLMVPSTQPGINYLPYNLTVGGMENAQGNNDYLQMLQHPNLEFVILGQEQSPNNGVDEVDPTVNDDEDMPTNW